MPNIAFHEDHLKLNFFFKLFRYKKIFVYKQIHKKIKNIRGVVELPLDFLEVRIGLSCEHWCAVNADKVYNHLISSRDKKVFERLGGDTYKLFIYRKRILQKMAPILYSFRSAEFLRKKYKFEEPLALFPRDFSYYTYKAMKEIGLLNFPGIEIPKIILLYSWARECMIAAYHFVRIFLYPEILLFKMKGKGIKGGQKVFPIGIHYDTGNRIGSKITKSIEFFIDGKAIKKDDVLFVTDHTQAKGTYLDVRRQGYHVLSLEEEMLPQFSPWKYLFYHYKEISLYRVSMLNLLFRHPWFAGISSLSLRNRALWPLFYELYFVKTFFNMMTPHEITREAMTRKYGSRSFFIHSAVSATYIDKGEDQDYPEMLYVSNMIFDKVISDIETNKWLSASQNDVREYCNVGVLYSDYVRNLTIEKKKEIRKILGVPEGKKLISYFDNTSGFYAVMSYADYYEYLQSMKKLLEKNQDFFIISKMKHAGNSLLDKDFPHEIKELFRALLRHPRFLEITNAIEIINFELLGASDLVISAMMSSMLFCSICGGIKTISYDPNNRYNQKCNVIVKCPQVCANNYDELEMKVDFWLDKSSDKDFEEVTERFLKPYIDPYCDGKAVDRFRDLLVL